MPVHKISTDAKLNWGHNSNIAEQFMEAFNYFSKSYALEGIIQYMTYLLLKCETIPINAALLKYQAKILQVIIRVTNVMVKILIVQTDER